MDYIDWNWLQKQRDRRPSIVNQLGLESCKKKNTGPWDYSVQRLNLMSR